MKKIFFLPILLILFFSSAFPQLNKDDGYPLIRNYSPKEYKADVQNWATAQGKNGTMYFGNNSGLLQYDGVNWTLNKTVNNSVIRSIAIAEDGKIFVGSVGELGYFEADSSGRLQYHSLLNYLKPENRDISDVWNTFIVNNEVIFETINYIFKWSPKTKVFTVIKPKNSFHFGIAVNNSFYTREWGIGLQKLTGDSLKLVPGGERFADERIYVMLPFPGEKNVTLIGTRTKGLFKYDGKNFIPFKTQADEFLLKNLIYSPGAVLKDGNIIIGTILGGAVIIDKNGNIIHIFDKATGLPSNTTYSLMPDKAGAIWMATDFGISRIDYSSPITYFDSRNGISSAATQIFRYNKILYACANNGSYYLEPSTSQFVLIPELANQSFDLIKVHGQLFVGCFDGVYQVNKNKVIPIRISKTNEYAVQFLYLSKVDTNRLYVATSAGMGLLYYQNGRWIDKGKIINIPDFTTSIVEEKDGTIWTGSGAFGVFRVKYPLNSKGFPDFEKPNIDRFDLVKGNSIFQVMPKLIDGKIYFLGPENIYRFNDKTNSFYVDSTFMIVPTSGSLLPQQIAKDSKGRLWLSRGRQPALGIPQPDGSYKWITSPFKRFSDELIQFIYPENDGSVWIGTGFGIIKYDMNKKFLYDSSFTTLLYKVGFGKGSRVFYSGYNSINNPPEISFSNNTAKFEFAATSYEEEERNQFKTLLEGFDDNWSDWSSENIREYTNLPPGKYKFAVIARNLSDVEGRQASFSFIILPPWYRTWWAYAGYAIILLLAVFISERLLRKRIIRNEQQRSYVREMELRAEVAEAENERKKNVELLSEIGRDISSNLTIEQIIDTVYKNVNSMMDASIFGIGIFEKENNRIVFPATKEKDIKLDTFTISIDDKDRPAVWCFLNQKEILINDYQLEYSKYINKIQTALQGENPASMLYLPLSYKDKRIGVITAQSFNKNSYTEYHLNILRNLATYTAIALDNADAYRQLNMTVNQLNAALDNLKSTQEKLVVQQKLASLGQLTAGIAHEIKNPLNFVNNFAELSQELIDELKEEFVKLKGSAENEQMGKMEEILSVIEQNIKKINEHGSRANRIVNSMLQHSRGKSGERIMSDINAILEEDLNLAYHGFRARDTSFNITIEKAYDKNLDKISIVPQDISRVFLNIINNGFYETNKKEKNGNDDFVPKLKVTTKSYDDSVEIRIMDNGNGIPEEIANEVFSPFFTTKPSGEGTGLGLSLSYDIIVKEHRGEIKFDTKLGEFTEFIITLPKIS